MTKRFFILTDDEEDTLSCIRDRTFSIKDIYGHYKYDDLNEICNEFNRLNDENEQLKQFFKELKGRGYWNDDYLTEQDWFDVKQWIERVCKKGDVE